MELPSAVDRDTIVECAIEMRFVPSQDSAEALIPGMVFGALAGRFRKSAPMALAQLPKALRDSQSSFRYIATTALESDHFKLLLGSHSAIVSVTKPYPGWSHLHPIVVECFIAVLKTTLVKDVERISMKYVNIVGSEDDQYNLSQLNVTLRLNDLKLRGPGAQVRAESECNGCTTIVQIQSGTTATIPKPTGDEKATGVGVNVDSIRPGPFTNIEKELPEILEILHTTSKQVFFGLLTKETLLKLGPH